MEGEAVRCDVVSGEVVRGEVGRGLVSVRGGEGVMDWMGEETWERNRRGRKKEKEKEKEGGRG